MKKPICMLLLAFGMMLMFCSCGFSSGKNAAEISDAYVVITPAPTATPTLTTTPEPTEELEEKTEEVTTGIVKNNGGFTLNQATATPAPTATPTPTTTPTPTANSSNSTSVGEEAAANDAKDIAQGLVGQSVSVLYSQIGYPNSSIYSSDSDQVIGGQDGVLYYSGFEVHTVVYEDGAELIIGIY